MKLSDYHKVYQEFSGQASEGARKLAFAGIAVCWIFRIGETNPGLPRSLIAPIALFAIGLGLDLLHYIAGSIIWGAFARIKEKLVSPLKRKPDITHSHFLTWPIIALFWLKIILVVTGHGLLISFLVAQWLLPLSAPG